MVTINLVYYLLKSLLQLFSNMSKNFDHDYLIKQMTMTA